MSNRLGYSWTLEAFDLFLVYAEYAGMIFSEVCSSEDELYMMQCPLICFWCVEWHLPHRVQRQFGRNQLCPVEDVPTSKELHK
jgi:hypothetical protein